MKIEEIRELVTLLEESKLSVLEIGEGENRIRLEKAAPPTSVYVETGSAPGAQKPGVALEAAAPAGSGPSHRGRAVKSPMVGVFYCAPAPGEEPFVRVGSQVRQGDVLCIVEAMKLMNEIPSEFSGEVTEVCAEDGEVVEYGQPLFYIE